MSALQQSPSKSLYASLVDLAFQHREASRRPKGNYDSVAESFSENRFLTNVILSDTIARELDQVNNHISIDEELVSEAIADYEEIGKQLIQQLKWEESDIRILPQGSSSTKTLIRSPGSQKFDIDAVCKVMLNRNKVWDPIDFFNQFEPAFSDYIVEAKNRCWRVNKLSNYYYIEFTPSVPIKLFPHEIFPKDIFSRYSDSALAVVDQKTKSWKPSNPEGMTQWVNDQSIRRLVPTMASEAMARTMMDSVEPVPEQAVPLHDTLRIAIRLSKRHRDMMIARGELPPKPISILIVTLLTQCYEGLADQGKTYQNHIELLYDLVSLMPHMVEKRGNEWWVENPTVIGENFAERWNTRSGEPKRTFDQWCKALQNDLDQILRAENKRTLIERIRHTFGTTSANAPTPPKGLAAKAPSSAIIQPAERGLA